MAVTEEAVSASTIKLLSLSSTSLEVLAADSSPAETLAAVHYFASDINTPKLVHCLHFCFLRILCNRMNWK